MHRRRITCPLKTVHGSKSYQMRGWSLWMGRIFGVPMLVHHMARDRWYPCKTCVQQWVAQPQCWQEPAHQIHLVLKNPSLAPTAYGQVLVLNGFLYVIVTVHRLSEHRQIQQIVYFDKLVECLKSWDAVVLRPTCKVMLFRYWNPCYLSCGICIMLMLMFHKPHHIGEWCGYDHQ